MTLCHRKLSYQFAFKIANSAAELMGSLQNIVREIHVRCYTEVSYCNGTHTAQSVKLWPADLAVPGSRTP